MQLVRACADGTTRDHARALLRPSELRLTTSLNANAAMAKWAAPAVTTRRDRLASGPHVERIDDDEVVERRRVRAAGDHDRQGMGSVGEPRRFVDGVLIAFDRRSLEGIDLGLEHTVQVHVGDPGRELAAADPAYRGPGEGEGGRRARDTGFGDGPEAPGPVDVALDPA